MILTNISDAYKWYTNGFHGKGTCFFFFLYINQSERTICSKKKVQLQLAENYKTSKIRAKFLSLKKKITRNFTLNPSRS